MKIIKYILLFAFSCFFYELHALEIEPRANKFEDRILKKVAEQKDVLSRAQILFEALNDERAGVSLIFNGANIAVQILDKAKAKELFMLAIKKMPSFYLAHRNLAYLYLEENDFENAQKEFSTALSLSKENARDIYSVLSYCHFSLKNYDVALTCVNNALIFAPNEMSLLKRKAQCLNELNDYTQLERTLTEILNREKGDVNIWRMIVSLHLKRNEKNKALVTLEGMKALSLLEHQDFILLGDIYLDFNMFCEASKAYENAKIEQEKAYKIARFFALSNKPNSAVKIAENLEKTSWQYFEIMGIVSQSNGENAKEFFEKSHAKNPLNAFVCLKLGDIYLSENKLESARTFYGFAKTKFKREAIVGLANVAIASEDFNLAINLLENLKAEFKTTDFDEIIFKLKNAK